MKKETIKLLDFWVGSFLCFLFTLTRLAFGFLRKKNTPIQSVLFIKLIEQGATVLIHSSLEQAIKRVGRNNVYFLVFEENTEIIRIMGLVPNSNIFQLRQKKFFLFVYDLLCALIRLRRMKISATVDMEFFARASALISFLTGAPHRVGLHRFNSEGPYRGNLMTRRVQYNFYLHTAQNYELLVDSLFETKNHMPFPKKPAPPTTPPPPFVPSNAEIMKIKSLIGQNTSEGKKRNPYIILNPNASDLLPLRKWPTDRFVSLGKRLLTTIPKLTLLLTGAPSEKERVNEIGEEIGGNTLCLAGKTTLREVLVLYTLCDMLITNDSGPGHFASLTDMTSLVLFGPETPFLFGALGKNSIPISANYACSPCVNVYNHRFSPCTDNLCMQAISVDIVYNQIILVLKKRGLLAENQMSHLEPSCSLSI